MKGIISLSLSLILFCCCVQQNRYERAKISGYSIGDSISSEFNIEKVLDYPFSRGRCIKDQRFEVSLHSNCIYMMSIKDLSEEETSWYMKGITNSLKQSPIYTKGKTHSGINIIGEEYCWSDTKSGDLISLMVSAKNENTFGVLIISNDTPFDTTSDEIELIEFPISQ